MDAHGASNLEEEYSKALKKQEKLKETIQSKTARALELDKFCTDFAQIKGQISELSESLWLSLVDHVTVYSKALNFKVNSRGSK